MKFTFLGTSAACPTANRNVTGLCAHLGGETVLFDCGEGSQRQMIRFGTGFSITTVFFTHFHADHYLGIIGFLRTIGMLGRVAPLRLYGPRGAKKILHDALHLGIEALPFPVEIIEIASGDEVIGTGYTVKAIGVHHRMEALGFVIEEEMRAGTFDVEKAKSLGVPEGKAFSLLQRGDSYTTETGAIIRTEDVTGEPKQGRKIVLSGDTRPCAAVELAAHNADLLIHESTFSNEEQERAVHTGHSTAAEAGAVAQASGCKKLVLTHFSSRFLNVESLVFEAKSKYEGTIEAAYDGLVVDVPRRA